jgi:predicted SAM-dependent methyltransferase
MPPQPAGGPHVWSPAERAKVDDYLAKHTTKKLQIGAGHMNLPEWLNTDIEPSPAQVYLDAAAPYPFPDKTFKYVYAEQLIEHLTFEQGQVFLKESFRVLQPGGRIRLSTPNLLTIIHFFDKDKSEYAKKFMDFQLGFNNVSRIPTPEAASLNLFVRAWGHQFLYDPESLRAALTTAGFKDIREVHLGQSDDPELRNIELHWTFVTDPTMDEKALKHLDEFVSQYVEAVRP